MRSMAPDTTLVDEVLVKPSMLTLASAAADCRVRFPLDVAASHVSASSPPSPPLALMLKALATPVEVEVSTR